VGRPAYLEGKPVGDKRHGVNVQVLADPHGELVWASPALPGSIHDLKAARSHGLIDALTRSAVATLADKGYRGARGTVGVPFYGRHLPTRMREVNAAHAKVRAIGERAVSTLKTWRLLAKLRCCPQRATTLVAAILTFHLQAGS
jgi:DDE superfamily endonuclease